MKMNYINKIKANISIYATKKTSNILDGAYKSVYKGRSMNFEDLREYIVGDNIKDIDWRASARSGKLLIKQFIAEKKHNIMLVLDTGKKMLADTKSNEAKKDISILTGGTIAYLANKNGDYTGAVYNKNNEISFFPFKEGLFNIERILSNYESDIKGDDTSFIENSLEYLTKNIKRRMIVFIITDMKGMDSVKEETLKRLTTMHDVMAINISDADMTGESTFDVEDDEYIPKLILQDKKLHELEEKMKQELEERNKKKFEKNRVTITTINNSQEIVPKTIELLERYRNANIR